MNDCLNVGAELPRPYGVYDQYGFTMVAKRWMFCNLDYGFFG
jgi:hypothetical protein